MERRRWPRLRLRLRIEFESMGGPQAFEGSGATENVSAGGVYFRTAHWSSLAPGQQMRFRLSGLGGYESVPAFKTLGGTAVVVRVEEPSKQKAYVGSAGVAVQFDRRPDFDWTSLGL